MMDSSTFMDVPKAFASVSEATNTFDLTCYIYANSRICQQSSQTFIQSMSPQAEAHRFSIEIERIRNALDNLMVKQCAILSPKEKEAAIILHLHLTNLHINGSPENNPGRWDKHEKEAEGMLALAEQALAFDEGYTSCRTSFCMEMGILMPIYNVAQFCRDPVIRRRAVKVLGSTYRQEGFLNSLLITKVAEKIVEIEEMGLTEVKVSSDVPESARLVRVNPIFDEDNKTVRIQYTQPGGNQIEVDILKVH